MNRQQSMKKCAAIKRALPVWGAPEGRVHGPHDPQGRSRLEAQPRIRRPVGRGRENKAGVMSNDIEEAVLAILKAAGELSAAQFALDRTPDATTVPRDFAARKVVDAFRTWEASAKAIKSPVRVSITLRPTEK